MVLVWSISLTMLLSLCLQNYSRYIHVGTNYLVLTANSTAMVNRGKNIIISQDQWAYHWYHNRPDSLDLTAYLLNMVYITHSETTNYQKIDWPKNVSHLFYNVKIISKYCLITDNTCSLQSTAVQTYNGFHPYALSNV